MKLLDLIERVVPRLRLYPLWAQRLFAVTFAMTLASFFAWAVMAPSAAETKEHSQLHLDVGQGGEATAASQGTPASPNGVTPLVAADRTLAAIEAPITYELNGRIVAPNVPYLNMVRAGGPLGGVDGFDWWDAAEEFPLLDTKIANTGSKTVFLTAASVHVGHSVPDLEPVPLVYQGARTEPRVFWISDQGWGRMEGIRLSYDVAAGISRTKFAKRYAYQTTPDARGVFDVSDGIAARQLPTRGLATVWGDLSYRWRDSGGRPHRHRARIVTTVYLAAEQPLVGAPAPIQGEYDVDLRVSGRNYDVVLKSFDRFIKPQTPDRFVIRVRTKRSSIHTGVEVRLRLSDGHVQRSQPLTLRIFVPQTAPSADQAGSSSLNGPLGDLNMLLAGSARRRGDVGKLIADVQSSPPAMDRAAALREIEEIVNQRERLHAELAALPAPVALSKSVALLRDSITASLAEDRIVRQWIVAHYDGDGAADSLWQAQLEASRAASNAERAFRAEYADRLAASGLSTFIPNY